MAARALRGTRYEPAEKTKSETYAELLPLLTGARVELLDRPRLLSQLLALDRRTARGGKDSIDHPPGAHDDVINAAAGALLAVALVPPMAKGRAGTGTSLREWLSQQDPATLRW